MTTTEPHWPGTGPGPFTQQAPPPPPPQAADEIPTFGRRAPDAPSVKRIPFNLAAYRGDTEVVQQFTARADIDLSSIFGLGSGKRSLSRQVEVLLNLLNRVVVDDDGISLHATVTSVVPNPQSDDEDDLVPVDQLPDGADYKLADVEYLTPEVRDRDGDVLVEEALHDTSDAATTHLREHGSSKRRFAAVMDDDDLWIEQDALEEIIDYLMSQAADRPTRRSSRPSRSRRPKGR